VVMVVVPVTAVLVETVVTLDVLGPVVVKLVVVEGPGVVTLFVVEDLLVGRSWLPDPP